MRCSGVDAKSSAETKEEEEKVERRNGGYREREDRQEGNYDGG